jgi:hypothetical protein
MKKICLGLAAVALAACGPKNTDTDVAAGASATDSANVAVSADTTMRDTTGYQAGGVITDTTLQQQDTTMQPPQDTAMQQQDTSGYQAGAAAGAALSATLVGVNDPAVSGSATLTDAGQNAKIEVTLSGAKKSGTHAAMIHKGTCDAPGAAVHSLKPLRASGDAKESTTNLTGHTISELGDGNHIVAVHASSAKSSAVLACGPIQGGGASLQNQGGADTSGYEPSQNADTSAAADTSSKSNWPSGDTTSTKADTSSASSSTPSTPQ